MSAAVALSAAEAAGVIVVVDGAYLQLRALEAPPQVVVDALARHKARIADLLRGEVRQQAPGEGCRQTCWERRNLPCEWAEGLAALALASPAEGFSAKEWQGLVNDAARFMHSWARAAVKRGWSILDVFGVHSLAPAARYDAMGLVPLIRGGEVIALDERRATIRMPSGAELTYLKRPRKDAVPIWEVARACAGWTDQ